MAGGDGPSSWPWRWWPTMGLGGDVRPGLRQRQRCFLRQHCAPLPCAAAAAAVAAASVGADAAAIAAAAEPGWVLVRG